jgi:hypothetical protein
VTTSRQIAANRANARKSTGPRSRKGKASAARNAVKHGLSTPPPWDQVTRWYRIIKEDPTASPDPSSPDELEQAILALAEAEAVLARAADAEAVHLARMAAKSERKGLRGIMASPTLDLDDIETLDFLIGQRGYARERKVLRLFRRLSPDRPAALHATRTRLARYRREAEARRRKALKTYRDLLKGQNSGNEPN